MSNTIAVSVVGDVRDINRKLGSVEKQLGGFGKSASRIGGLLKTAFAGAVVTKFFTDVVKSASDAQQSLGATETVFGKFADTVVKQSETAATKYGLSANSYRENANLIGSLFKNQGVSMDQLGSKTDAMISKAADLSATFGGDTKTAVEALSSAFKGEFDPLEKYGISLKQSTVSAEAMRLANVKSKKEWDGLSLAQQRAATQQATTNLINKQSAASAGAFSKETGTLAHQQQVLAAKFENVKAKIGTAFLPILTKAFSFLSDKALPAVVSFGQEMATRFGPTLQQIGDFITGTLVPGFQSLVTWLQQNWSWLGPIAVGIGAIVIAWKAYQAYLAITTAITKAYIAVQTALNVVMSLNPIGIIVLAIIGLIAALVYLWKTNEGFRKVVIKVWDAIKSAVGATVNWFKTAIPAAWNWVKAKTSAVWNAIKGFFSSVWNGIKGVVSGAVNGVKGAISRAWNSVKSANSAAWNFVKSTISKVWDGIKTAVTTAIERVVSTVRGIKAKVLGVFTGANTWLRDAGRRVLQGLLDGIENMIRKVKDKLSVLTKLIPSWKGPARVDKKLLYGAGQLIMEGLIEGIDDKTSALKRQLRDVTGIVKGTDVGTVGGGSIALSTDGLSGGGSGASAVRYEITVNVPPTADKASIGRELVSAIEAHERRSGKGWRS